MKQKFELTLTSTYASDWGVQDALRELMQNAIDQSVVIEGNDYTVTYNEDTQTLLISNKKSILKNKSLLLGFTTKKDKDNTIGQFGEGYKIALLVLTRLEKNVSIFINNNNKKEVWTAKFVTSKRYEGEKILTVFTDTQIEEKYKSLRDTLTIIINNISKSEYEDFVERTLQLQGVYNGDAKLLICQRGNILLDEKYKGKIFVNGLYITTIPNFVYGYNIKPEYLKIGRDRNLVNSFDIQCETSYMWREHNCDELQEMILNQASDIKYIWSDWCDTKEKKNLGDIGAKVYETLKETNDSEAIIPVTNQKEYNEVVSIYKDATPIIVSELEKTLIVNSEPFKTRSETYEKLEISPLKELDIWKDKYRGEILYTSALNELDAIIEKIMKI